MLNKLKEKISEKIFQKKYKDLYSKIINFTTWNTNASFAERKYNFLYKMNDFPLCPVCGQKIVNFDCFSRGYKSNCSIRCSRESGIIKAEKTNLIRYGHKNPAHSKQAKQKIKHTNLERYGPENVFASEEIKDKIKQTNLEKYGVESTNKLDSVKAKIKNTTLKNFGVENLMYLPEIKRSRTIKSNITKREKYWKIFKPYLKNKNIIPLFTKEEYIDWLNEKLTYKCLDCNKEFKWDRTSIQNIYCPYCLKEKRSQGEKELAVWLKDLGLNIVESDRNIIKPKELDIFLPDYNLAIEYNGLYWHSNKYANKNDLLIKTCFCEDKNIQLLHIFENEWINKENIVKSIILAKLGIFKQRIYARKCIVKEINSNEYKSFCIDIHIQGYAAASKRLGLFYNDELVSIASWSKSRFKKNEYELIRFCTKLNTQIVGGLSKLIKASNIDEFITYCDLRYSNGNGYKNSGFELLGQSSPNYFYFKGLNLESRQKYQKHKLSKLLENFDPNLSERENMATNKFLWIYDCGNLKFKYKN